MNVAPERQRARIDLAGMDVRRIFDRRRIDRRSTIEHRSRLRIAEPFQQAP
jgi:hypothetical protein